MGWCRRIAGRRIGCRQRELLHETKSAVADGRRAARFTGKDARRQGKRLGARQSGVTILIIPPALRHALTWRSQTKPRVWSEDRMTRVASFFGRPRMHRTLRAASQPDDKCFGPMALLQGLGPWPARPTWIMICVFESKRVDHDPAAGKTGRHRGPHGPPARGL